MSSFIWTPKIAGMHVHQILSILKDSDKYPIGPVERLDEVPFIRVDLERIYGWAYEPEYIRKPNGDDAILFKVNFTDPNVKPKGAVSWELNGVTVYPAACSIVTHEKGGVTMNKLLGFDLLPSEKFAFDVELDKEKKIFIWKAAKDLNNPTFTVDGESVVHNNLEISTADVRLLIPSGLDLDGDVTNAEFVDGYWTTKSYLSR